MIAPDHDRRADLAPRDEIVDAFPEFRALAVAEPAHPGRQSLKRHALAGELDPSGEGAVLGKELEDESIGAPDIGGVAGESDPAERTASFREEGTDVCRHEPWVAERLGVYGRLRLAPQVVAVVEGDGASRCETDDGFGVPRDRSARPAAGRP